jgi:hypothetical protein
MIALGLFIFLVGVIYVWLKVRNRIPGSVGFPKVRRRRRKEYRR